VIKTERYRALCGILFSVMLLIILSACGSHKSSNEGESMISKDKDEISFKLKNTKSIGIYDVISSDSNDNAHIKDPEIINQIESLFNKTSFIKCTTQTPTQARCLLVSFYIDSSSSISLFVIVNDIVDIDGIKYKSDDITFDAINTLYLKYK
jgi:L-cystine transport system substrate-binding protein